MVFLFSMRFVTVLGSVTGKTAFFKMANMYSIFLNKCKFNLYCGLSAWRFNDVSEVLCNKVMLVMYSCAAEVCK